MEIREYLSEKFKSFSAKPIVFFGAGMSKRYLSSPSWEDLLKVFSRKIHPENQFSWGYYRNQAETAIKENNWSQDSLYPYIATLIRNDYNLRFYKDIDFEKELKAEIEDKDYIPDPFKYAVVEYLEAKREETEVLHYEMMSLLELNNRVSNFVTTNYDSFLETIFDDYQVLVGQEQILNSPALPFGNIYKIHGSSSEPENIVFTKEDYDDFSEKSRFLSSKLLTMFVENPIIFLGYSISDPDILKILSDIQMCLSSENKKKFLDKMIFVEFVSEGSEGIIEKTISGIDMTVIRLHDYTVLYDSFKSIIDRIDVFTLRKIQAMIHELIETTKPNAMKVHIVGLNDPDLKNSELAATIGPETAMTMQGYFTPSLIDICEDVLFNNKSYESEKLIKYGILQNKIKFNTSKLPLYKYKKKTDEVFDEWVEEKIIKSIEDLYSNSEKKRMNTHPMIYDSVQSIVDGTQNFKEIIDNIFFSLKSLDAEEIAEYLIENWGRQRELSQKTRFTKIVCYIDFVRNK